MGTMRERSPGSWELTVSAGVDPSTGRYARVIRTVQASTKRAAKAALRELEVEVAGGQIGLDDPTVTQLLERWMTHLEDIGRSPATLYNYRRYVDRELAPTIGALRLSKLTASHLDGLYSALRRRGLAPATIRQIHAIVRAALHQAVRWGLVSRNVASLASRAVAAAARAAAAHQSPRSSRSSRPPTRVEPLFGLYVRVMAATGMRRAEVCGLRWSDIDLDDGRLVVQRSHLSLAGLGRRPTDEDPLGPDRHSRPDTVGALKSAMAGAPPAGPICWRRRRSPPGRLRVQLRRRRRSAWRGDTADAGGRRPVGAPVLVERPASRPPALASHAAARRRGAGSDRRRPPRPRGRHHDDEDLRASHQCAATRWRRRSSVPPSARSLDGRVDHGLLV